MNLIGNDYKSFTKNKILGFIQTTNLPQPIVGGKVAKMWYTIESFYNSQSYLLVMYDLHRTSSFAQVNRRVKCAFQILTKWTGYTPNINTKRFQGELASALYRAINAFRDVSKNQTDHICRDAVIDDIRLYDPNIPCRYVTDKGYSEKGVANVTSIFYNQDKKVESFMFEIYDKEKDETLYFHPGSVHLDVEGRKLICPKRSRRIQNKC